MDRWVIRVLAPVLAIAVSACANTQSQARSAHSPHSTWSALGMSAVRLQTATRVHSVVAPSSSPPRHLSHSSALPLPRSVDRLSADAVAVTGAEALARADTSLDDSPNDTAVRAAHDGWLTPQFARNVESATISGSSGAQWTEWTRHRARVVVTGRLSGDDHPEDTPTTAARAVVLTLCPVGRDGWRGRPSIEVVGVVLKKINNLWRIDSDQRI